MSWSMAARRAAPLILATYMSRTAAGISVVVDSMRDMVGRYRLLCKGSVGGRVLVGVGDVLQVRPHDRRDLRSGAAPDLLVERLLVLVGGPGAERLHEVGCHRCLLSW